MRKRRANHIQHYWRLHNRPKDLIYSDDADQLPDNLFDNYDGTHDDNHDDTYDGEPMIILTMTTMTLAIMAMLQRITKIRSFKAKLETHSQPAAVDFDDKDISERR